MNKLIDAVASVLCDSKHPAWNLAQRVVSLACIVALVWHLSHRAHNGNVDADDVVLGGGLVLKLAAEMFSAKQGS